MKATMMSMQRPACLRLGQVFCFLSLFMLVEAAPLKRAFTYQGRLQDGGLPANGVYDFKFQLFGAANGGTALATRNLNEVAVAGGLFTVQVEFGVDFSSQAYFLEVSVRPGDSSGSYTVLDPRQELTPVPFAEALPNLRIETGSVSPNLIGGYTGNSVYAGKQGATIGGGGYDDNPNLVGDSFGTVGGGWGNRALGLHAAVAGGGGNLAGTKSFVGGGESNQSSGTYATTGGGYSNRAQGNYAVVGGGYSNYNNGVYAVIGGGCTNEATGSYATVAGGVDSIAGGWGSAIGGGTENEARGEVSTVSGGEQNLASEIGSAVGGGFDNAASGAYSAIGGGGENVVSKNYGFIGGGNENVISGSYSFIGSGVDNLVTSNASVIGGGNTNTVSGLYSTISGGEYNSASGYGSTVPGGTHNLAHGDFSFAAGYRAKADHDGSFVLTDATDADFRSVRDNSLRARFNGGLTFQVNDGYWFRVWANSGRLLDSSTGAHLTTGGTWVNGCRRASKEHFVPADGAELLERLADVPILYWNYISEGDAVRHLGPVAEDFQGAFGLGSGDGIATVDADGVALAAIQALHAQLQSERSRGDALQHRLASLEMQNEALAARLAALETLLTGGAGLGGR